MRNMQVLQPQIKKIQEKYKGDRERTSQELMKLYKDTGTNPLSSCMPVLAQAPIFFALFKVLDGIAKGKPVGVLDQADVDSASQAVFLGANLADKFVGAETLTVQVVTVIMILLMSLSQFITQKQLMVKNLPPGAEDNPYMKQQKIMMYLFPIMFAVFGINFPVGVLLYWLVSNTWSMGQQLFVIRRMPVEGSIAHKALQERQAKKGSPPEDLAGQERASRGRRRRVGRRRLRRPLVLRRARGTGGAAKARGQPGQRSRGRRTVRQRQFRAPPGAAAATAEEPAAQQAEPQQKALVRPGGPGIFARPAPATTSRRSSRGEYGSDVR